MNARPAENIDIASIIGHFINGKSLFCTSVTERVYITVWGWESGFDAVWGGLALPWIGGRGNCPKGRVVGPI